MYEVCYVLSVALSYNWLINVMSCVMCLVAHAYFKALPFIVFLLKITYMGRNMQRFQNKLRHISFDIINSRYTIICVKSNSNYHPNVLG
jgi:hypothetical protein